MSEQMKQWTAHATTHSRSGVTEYEIHWSEDGECIAEIVHGAEAAALIAAAPHMLKTLKGVRDTLVRLAWEENSLLIEGLNASIDKAEGRS